MIGIIHLYHYFIIYGIIKILLKLFYIVIKVSGGNTR